MDLSDEAVSEAFESRVRRREWHTAGFAVVCSSLSMVLHPRVRDVDHRWGRPAERLPPRLKRRTGVEYVAMHNRMLIACFRLV